MGTLQDHEGLLKPTLLYILLFVIWTIVRTYWYVPCETHTRGPALGAS